MIESLKGFHLEPTNVCMLKCPRCARTKFVEQFGMKNWDNLHLNLGHLKKFIDIDISGKVFTLCGTYGDPIYYTDLLPLVEWIKSNSGIVSVVTNGSYKKAEWWNALCTMLDSTDSVVFSIDGAPENFTNYRVNADWDSIKIGIDAAVASKSKTIWKYIPFSFNENDVEKISDFSYSIGVDEFIVDPSDRWDGDDDTLRPIKFIGAREQAIKFWQKDQKKEIFAKCKIDNGHHYISASGHYMPCCFVSDHRFYFKSEFYKNKEKYDISKTTLTQVIEQTKTFYDSLEESSHNYCTFNCPKYD